MSSRLLSMFSPKPATTPAFLTFSLIRPADMLRLQVVRSQEGASTCGQIATGPPSQAQLAMSLAQEQGASSWLTALPLTSHGFCLSKGKFRDALCLRYGWTPDGLPSHCPDGNAFTVEHALSCPRGGYIALRHNEIRDVLAELMQETCCNFATEPELQPLSGEVFEHLTAVTYFDVRVFNRYAALYLQKPLRKVCRMHEQEKQRCVWGTGEANRTRHVYAIGVHLHGRCRPRGYPVPEVARKPARGQASHGL